MACGEGWSQTIHSKTARALDAGISVDEVKIHLPRLPVVKVVQITWQWPNIYPISPTCRKCPICLIDSNSMFVIVSMAWHLWMAFYASRMLMRSDIHEASRRAFTSAATICSYVGSLGSQIDQIGQISACYDCYVAMSGQVSARS